MQRQNEVYGLYDNKEGYVQVLLKIKYNYKNAALEL